MRPFSAPSRALFAQGALFAFFGAFLLYPLLYVFYEAFVIDGRFSLLYFSFLIGSRSQWELLFNSINIALAVTLLSALIAVPLALLFVRRRFPGEALLHTLVLAPLLLPPFVGAVGLQKLLGRFGVINSLLIETGVTSFPLDLLGSSGAFGVILMQTLHLYPLLYLLFAAALGGVDRTLEEAAYSVGAGARTTFLRVTLPLALPGFFAGAVLVFVGSLTDLGTPLMFQYRATITVQIYQLLGEVSGNPYGYAVVVFLTLLCALLFLLTQRGITGHTVHSGGRTQGRSERRTLEGMPLWCAYASVLLLVIGALLPHLGVLLYSVSGGWIMKPLPAEFTFAHFKEVFAHPLSSSGLLNSVMLSAVSMIVTAVIGVVAAYLLRRTRVWGRAVLEALCLIPLAVPGIVIAFGYASSFSGTMLDNRYNPFPLLILAYSVRKLPFMVRAVSAGLESASPTFEEAALTVGADRKTAFLRITLPLIGRQVLAGGLLVFAFSMLEVSDSLLLALEEKYFPVSKALYALSLRPDGLPLASALAVVSLVVTGGCLLVAQRMTKRRADTDIRY